LRSRVCLGLCESHFYPKSTIRDPQSEILADSPPCYGLAASAFSLRSQSEAWARQDSNLGPRDYESPALPLSYRPICSGNLHSTEAFSWRFIAERLARAVRAHEVTNNTLLGTRPSIKLFAIGSRNRSHCSRQMQTKKAGLGFIYERNRFARRFDNLNLYVDFLTEDPPYVTARELWMMLWRASCLV
jgi:hypothetical protein